MAADYEDFHDIESMTDAALESLIREQFNEHPDLDGSRVDIAVADGTVRLEGRVGTEGELQILEHIVTDVLGIERITNELVVDELMRGEQAEAADVANARVYAADGGARGGADRTEDTAEHLLEDTQAEQYGTSDMGEAIERGQTYNPPDAPVQEGNWSRENH